MLNGPNHIFIPFGFIMVPTGTPTTQGGGFYPPAEGAAATQDGVVWSSPDQQSYGVQYQNFLKSFTPEIVASLFGLDPAKLNTDQLDNLTRFIFELDQENLRRSQSGQPPLTREEINQAINRQIAAHDMAQGQPGAQGSTIGKTFKELGINELSEQQFNQIQAALQQYNAGQPVTKPVTEEQQPGEGQFVDEGAPVDQGGEVQQGGGGEQAGAPAQAAAAAAPAAAAPAGPAGTGQHPVPQLAGDLAGLQQQKAEAQNKIGDIRGQIDSKTGAINQRKSDLARQAAEASKNEEVAGLLAEHDEALAASNEASNLKQTAQNELAKTNLDLSQNSKDLYQNAADRKTNSQALQTARTELGNLKAPTPPSDDDPEAREAYQAAQAEYKAQKSEIEGRIRELEAERDRLQSELDNLLGVKNDLEQAKAGFEQEITTQTEAMAAAQATMDEKMQAMQAADPALKQAVEEDPEIQALQAEIQALGVDLQGHEAHLQEVDNAIAVKEQEDAAIQEMREYEAQQNFQAALDDAGAPVKNLQAQAQNELAQERYGKPYSELSKEEMKALEFELEGRSTTEAMEWAEETLRNDPHNEQALALVDAGQVYLEKRAQVAETRVLEDIDGLPDDLKAGASTAMNEAIEAAQAEGTDPNLAARQALVAYTEAQLESGDLAEEDRAALKNLNTSSADYSSATASAAQGWKSVHAAVFYQQVEELPPEAREEAYLLRDSVEALTKPMAQEKVQDAVAEAQAWQEANPNQHLTMEQARNMWGEYGPVALAAVQDTSGDQRVATMLLGQEGQEPYSGGTKAYNGDVGELYRTALTSHAEVEVAHAKQAWADHTDGQDIPAEEWIATGTDNLAVQTRSWQALTLTSEAINELSAPRSAAPLVEAAAVIPTGNGGSIPVPHGYNEIVATFGQPGDSSNLVTREMPAGPNGQMVSVTVHAKIADDLQAAFEEIHARGLSDEIASFDGTYNPRKKRGGSTWSTHAWGIAVDINASRYPMGVSNSSTSERYQQIAQIMASHGFSQIPNDPMHFQYATGY
jgi:hypothetical protein